MRYRQIPNRGDRNTVTLVEVRTATTRPRMVRIEQSEVEIIRILAEGGAHVINGVAPGVVSAQEQSGTERVLYLGTNVERMPTDLICLSSDLRTEMSSSTRVMSGAIISLTFCHTGEKDIYYTLVEDQREKSAP